MPCPSRGFPDSAIPRKGVHYLTRPSNGHVESLQIGTGAAFRFLPPENATGNSVKVVQRAGENRIRRAARIGPCAGPGYVRGARGERAMATPTPANIALTRAPSRNQMPPGLPDGRATQSLDHCLRDLPLGRPGRLYDRHRLGSRAKACGACSPCRHDCRPRRKKLRAISSMIK
jgi:hypothetical protein